MVDVVANYVGPVGDDFNSIFPFNRSIKDFNNYQEVEYCRLSGLSDLNQDNSMFDNSVRIGLRPLYKLTTSMVSE